MDEFQDILDLMSKGLEFQSAIRKAEIVNKGFDPSYYDFSCEVHETYLVLTTGDGDQFKINIDIKYRRDNLTVRQQELLLEIADCSPIKSGIHNSADGWVYHPDMHKSIDRTIQALIDKNMIVFIGNVAILKKRGCLAAVRLKKQLGII